MYVCVFACRCLAPMTRWSVRVCQGRLRCVCCARTRSSPAWQAGAWCHWACAAGPLGRRLLVSLRRRPTRPATALPVRTHYLQTWLVVECMLADTISPLSTALDAHVPCCGALAAGRWSRCCCRRVDSAGTHSVHISTRIVGSGTHAFTALLRVLMTSD